MPNNSDTPRRSNVELLKELLHKTKGLNKSVTKFVSEKEALFLEVKRLKKENKKLKKTIKKLKFKKK